MENKTISQLNENVWYRFLKVIFGFLILITLLVFNSTLITSPSSLDNDKTLFIEGFIIGNLIILLVFEVLRRVFYYVVLGSLRPPK